MQKKHEGFCWLHFFSAPPQAVLPLWLCKGMQGGAASAPRDPPRTSRARPSPVTGEIPRIAPHPSSSNRSLAVAVVFRVVFLPAHPSRAALLLYFTPCAQGPQLNASVRRRRPQGLEPCPIARVLTGHLVCARSRKPRSHQPGSRPAQPFAFFLSGLLPKQH